MPSKNQAVLITGSNGGIGQALCQSFFNENYYVIATDSGDQSCTCDKYIKANLINLVDDDAELKQFKDIVQCSLKDREAKGLINNAAIQVVNTLSDLELVDFQSTLAVNLIAPLLLVKIMEEGLTASSGSVVNIGSIHSKLTKPGFISYATSKSALFGLTQALAVDVGQNFRVNIIQPAATETEMLIAGFSGNEEVLNQLKSYHPLNRIAKPDDIAKAALFLVSSESGFISGTSIDIDGAIGCRLHDPK